MRDDAPVSPSPDFSSESADCSVTQFGDTPELADSLGRLVAAGVKTATCAALWAYEAENAAIPVPGQRAVVVDGRNRPLCVIEITEVELHRFCDVDASFAYDEGEDDRSLESWRREHWKYFTRTLQQIQREPIHEMPLVCERFKVIDAF